MDNSLTVQDLEYILNLIDLSATKGCLLGDDLLIVGTLRSKFANAINLDSDEKSLSLQDFSLVINLIEVITRRGGLQGEDILPVGQLRQKVINFLEQTQKITEQENLGDNNG